LIDLRCEPGRGEASPSPSPFSLDFDYKQEAPRDPGAVLGEHTYAGGIGRRPQVAGGVAQRETGTRRADWCEDGALGRTARYGTLWCIFSVVGLP